MVNNQTFLYALLFLFAMVIVSFSQMLLKKSATITYPNHLREYLNVYVIAAYGIAVLSNFLNNIAFQHVTLSLGTILMATEYIFVAILSVVFFKEKLGKKKLLGLILIVAGAVIFAL